MNMQETFGRRPDAGGFDPEEAELNGIVGDLVNILEREAAFDLPANRQHQEWAFYEHAAAQALLGNEEVAAELTREQIQMLRFNSSAFETAYDQVAGAYYLVPSLDIAEYEEMVDDLHDTARLIVRENEQAISSRLSQYSDPEPSPRQQAFRNAAEGQMPQPEQAPDNDKSSDPQKEGWTPGQP